MRIFFMNISIGSNPATLSRPREVGSRCTLVQHSPYANLNAPCDWIRIEAEGGHQCRRLRVGHRRVTSFLVEFASGGEMEAEVAAPSRRIISRAVVLDLGGIEQLFDALARAIGADR